MSWSHFKNYHGYYIMQVLNSALKQFNSVADPLNKSLSVLKTNQYISSAVTLFLVLYAGLAAPVLPSHIAGLFDYRLFKLAVLFLVLVLLKGQNHLTALLVSVGFVVSMNTLTKYKVFTMANEMVFGRNESFEEDADVVDSEDVADVEPVLAESAPDGVAAGSHNVTYSSDGARHSVTLRGQEYVSTDEPNHLPNGHGDLQGQAPENNVIPAYEGGDYATIGTERSQL